MTPNAPDAPDRTEPSEEGPDDPALAARLIGARLEVEPLTLALMKANAARVLFARAAEVRVGRYLLQRELGAGGGGTVFVARDPELDREVALKVISAGDASRRGRALAEGQALARLAHPNVVPVFDVGEDGHHVYLAMELVTGESLRVLAGHASARVLIAAYRQAGAGLVAAHAAGLVHRDFKPDNAVLGRDGRVRVVDFGLAAADGATASGGTPRYMAPEQRAGAVATAAADQFAFAAALREGVTHRGAPLPRWLERPLRRAQADAARDRFPTLAALLRELERDPATRWRRRALVAAPIGLIGLGAALGWTRAGGTAAAPRCDQAPAQLAAAWTEARGREVRTRVAGLGGPYATALGPAAERQLSAYAESWRRGHHAACEAAPATPSARVIDRRAACLVSARNQLGAVVDLMLTVAAEQLGDAARALAELPPVERCALDGGDAGLVTAPPLGLEPAVAEVASQLDRVRVRTAAAAADAPALAARAVAQARQLGYRPLLARALLAEGRARFALDQRAAAVAPLEEATDLALVVGDDVTALEAYAREVLARPVSEHEALRAGARPMLGLAARLGPAGRLGTALLHNHLGVVEFSAGRREAARVAWSTALALARQLDGPDVLELAWVWSNLARVSDDATRAALLAEVVALTKGRLGADHPQTLYLAIDAAFWTGEVGATRAAMAPLCDRLAELHPTRAATIVECSYELGVLDLADGDPDAASRHLARVVGLAQADVDADSVRLAAAFLAALDGQPGAADLFRAVLRGLAVTDATPWFQLLPAADAELGLAMTLPHAERAAARARAHALLVRAAAVSPGPVVQRRLAWADAPAR
ncbi:MAG: serine/threonine protein kinase [Kofleriaceae bacterium]|nr:serine/threonine protein kinase [Kofleriaceae bacterium]MBP9202442.1 serine/threonine protein kinase [Kofleriaceae bacterium]